MQNSAEKPHKFMCKREYNHKIYINLFKSLKNSSKIPHTEMNKAHFIHF